jgi:hypothetical protein
MSSQIRDQQMPDNAHDNCNLFSYWYNFFFCGTLLKYCVYSVLIVLILLDLLTTIAEKGFCVRLSHSWLRHEHYYPSGTWVFISQNDF